MGVIEKQSIQDIADAIRDRNGLTTLYKPRQMDEAIRGLYKTEAVNHIFDNLTISTTAQGSSITITDADTTKQAEITEIRGNSSVVTGDNNIVVSNKNLLKLTNGTITVQGLTSIYNNGKLTYSGTVARTYVDLTSSAYYEIPAGTYTFSATGDIVGTVRLRLYNESGTYTDYSITNSKPSITFTINDKKVRSYLWMLGLTVGNTYSGTMYLQLEKGTTATSYIAHQGNSYRVDLGGKNKLNPFVNYNAGYSTTIRGVTFTINQDGTITANGTATGGSATLILYGSWSGTTVYQTLDKTKNYCLPSLGNKQIIFVRTYDNGTFTTYNSNTQRTISNKENIVYFAVEISNGETVENYVFKPQLEEGTTPTEYSPYTSSPIELTEQDKLWNNNGTWQLNNTAITDNYLLEQLQALENIELYEDLCYVDWVGNEKADMSLLYYVDGEKILEEIRKE